MRLVTAHAEQIVYQNNQAVGLVVGDRLQKRLAGSRDFVRVPPSIPVQESVLVDAQKLGATTAAVFDTETGTIYESSFATIRSVGRMVDYGHGRQLVLPLKHWHCIYPPINSTPELEAGL